MYLVMFGLLQAASGRCWVGMKMNPDINESVCDHVSSTAPMTHLWKRKPLFFFPVELINLCVCLRLLPGKSSQWKGTVLDQVPVNPSLYLIKYDGFDCIYGLELYNDERVVGLEVLPDRVGEEELPPLTLCYLTHIFSWSVVFGLCVSTNCSLSDCGRSSSGPRERLAAGGHDNR